MKKEILEIKFENESYILWDNNADWFNRFWLENERGEGMEVSEEELFRVLDNFFKENY